MAFPPHDDAYSSPLHSVALSIENLLVPRVHAAMRAVRHILPRAELLAIEPCRAVREASRHESARSVRIRSDDAGVPTRGPRRWVWPW